MSGRRTQLYRVMPWFGGINTSVDPGILNSQELVQADNVQFSSTGARIKREALEYLDNAIAAPDFRSSSGTTRTLEWTSSVLVGTAEPEQKLVVGEKISVTGNNDYAAENVAVTSVSQTAEVTSVICVADVSGSLNNKYFFISAGDDGTDYYVWFNVSGAGVDPSIAGRTGLEVTLSTNDSAGTVATAVAGVLNPLPEFAASAISTTVTVTASDLGFCQDATAASSGFTVTVTTQGGTNITYEVDDTFSESITAASGVEVARASAVIMVVDYWRFDGSTRTSELIFATNNFQLFKIESGRRTQIVGQGQSTAVTTLAASSITTGDYFLLNGPNNETNYYVWYNKASGGGDPLVAGRTGVQVAIGGSDTAAQVATATASAVDALSLFTASALSTVVTITAVNPGLLDETIDGNSPHQTGFTFQVLTYGATAPVNPVDRIRTNVFNENLQIYFSGMGNYPIIYNPDRSPYYQLMGSNTSAGLTMPDASFAFNFLSRVWADDKNNLDRLHYSDTFDEFTWLGINDSGAIDVIPGDGDPEGIINGYVYKDFIVAAKKDGRYRINGDSPENFQAQKISSGMGNEGPMSIPVDEGDVIFISKRGIHSQEVTDRYGDTDAAYLSADIKPTFNTFETGQLKNIQGAYIPELNSIALSIAEKSDEMPSNIWLYNIEVAVPNKQKPGAWYRWPDISCTALARRFVSGKHKLVFGTVNGRIIQAQKENDFTDFGDTGIPYKIKTGTIYPGDDPQTMKLFKRITMIYRPKGNFSFDVLAKIDNHQQQGFAFNEISGLDLLGETFILGTSLLGSANTLAPFTFTMEGYGRGVTLTVSQPSSDEQIEVWGFIIEYENADLEQEVQ